MLNDDACGLGHTPEGRLTAKFRRFMPVGLARVAAREMTLLAHARIGLRAFALPQASCAASYAGGSKVALGAVILAVAVVPDAVFLLLLIPHAYIALAVFLSLLDVWAVVWLFGFYGTMVARPHDLNSGRITLHNGLLQSATFAPEHVGETTVRSRVKRRSLPRELREGAAFLGFGDLPILQIDLCEPASAYHAFTPQPRSVLRIFVASDAPEQLQARIHALASSAAMRSPKLG